MKLVKDYILAVPEPGSVATSPRRSTVIEVGPDVKYAYKGKTIITKPGAGDVMLLSDGSKRILLVEDRDLIGYE